MRGLENFLFKNPIWEGSVFDCPIYGRVQAEINLLTLLTIFALKNKKQLISLDKFRCFLRILLSVRISVSVHILVTARILVVRILVLVRILVSVCLSLIGEMVFCSTAYLRIFPRISFRCLSKKLFAIPH